MKKISISTILIVFVLLLLSPNANAALNFNTTDLGVVAVGDTMEIEFSNVTLGNEKTLVTITFDTSVLEWVSSSDPTLVLNKNNAGVTMEVPNNYSAKLNFKCIKAPTEGKAYLKFASNDNGATTELILGLTVNNTVNIDNNTNTVVQTNTVTTTNTVVTTNTLVTTNTVVKEPVNDMPNTGSLDYIVPIIIFIVLAGVIFVYKKNKNLY